MHAKTREMIFRTVRGANPKPPTPKDCDEYEQAQDLCYDAMESSSDDAIKKAIQALKLSRFSSDACNILADLLACNLAEELALYRWATRIGEIYLGKDYFETERGHFYGLLETRPYMRARFGVARALFRLGCHEESIVHLEEMVELDSGDHLGARLLLLVEYLMIGRYTAFHDLIAKCDNCCGCYGRYGEVFFLDAVGDTDEKYEEALDIALSENKFVSALLANPCMEVERSGFGVSWSGTDGADEYLNFARDLWESHPDIKRRLISESAKRAIEKNAE